MKYIITFYLLFLSYTINAQATAGRDSLFIKQHLENIHSNTDSIISLQYGSHIIYASDSLFSSQQMLLNNDSLILIDLRYKSQKRGYVKVGVNLKNHILFKARDQGSGNPETLYAVNKNNGLKTFGDRYPFYIDSGNETLYYEYNEYIYIRSLNTGKIERYFKPLSIHRENCNYSNFLEIIMSDSKSFTIKYKNEEGKLVKKEYERI